MSTAASDIDVAATRALADAMADPAAPLADVLDLGPFDLKVLTEVCQRAGWQPYAVASDEALLDVALALIDCLPMLRALPLPHVPPELGWAPLRVFFSGLGHGYWAALVPRMAAVCPECQWSADENAEDWYTSAQEARRICGMPLSLAAVPLAALNSAVVPEEAPLAPTWTRIAVAWHILRHLRRSPRFGLVATYRGSAVAFRLSDAGSTAASALTTRPILAALGVPPTGGKDHINVLGQYAATFLSNLPIERLCARRSRHQLPGAVLTASWSRLVPQVDTTTRWWHHNLTLADVYVAAGGRVKPATAIALTADDVLGYDWHIGSPPDADPLWAESIPNTYATDRWPSAILAEAFPNLRWGADHNDTLVDAILLASVLRPTTPTLAREYPLLLILAGRPDSEYSTNNGKSLLAQAVLQAMAPGAQLLVARTGADAPQQRALLGAIANDGTVGLDEWRCALGPEHVLNREALQTLCTGGRLLYGRVHSNDSHYAQLRNSLVANAKAVSLSEDLVTRTVPIWVDPLTDSQRANAGMFQRIISGQLATELRLAAIAQMNAYAWRLAPGDITGTSATGLRFNTHRFLAAQILYYKKVAPTIDAALGRIDAATRETAAAYRAHTAAAHSSGLMSELSSPGGIDFSIDEVVEAALQVVSPTILAGTFHRHSRSPLGGTAGNLVSALTAPGQARGLNPSAAIAEMLGAPIMATMRPRVLTRRIRTELCRLMPTVGSAWPLPGDWGLAGWRFIRLEDTEDGRFRLQIDCLNPTTTKETT